jgi:hypothetical protein
MTMFNLERLSRPRTTLFARAHHHNRHGRCSRTLFRLDRNRKGLGFDSQPATLRFNHSRAAPRVRLERFPPESALRSSESATTHRFSVAAIPACYWPGKSGWTGPSRKSLCPAAAAAPAPRPGHPHGVVEVSVDTTSRARSSCACCCADSSCNCCHPLRQAVALLPEEPCEREKAAAAASQGNTCPS